MKYSFRLVETENKLAATEEQCACYEKEHIKLNKQIEESEINLKTSEKQITELQEENTRITNHITELENKNSDFTDQMERLQETCDEYTNVIALHEERMHEKEKEIQSMKDKSGSLFERLEQLEILMKGLSSSL